MRNYLAVVLFFAATLAVPALRAQTEPSILELYGSYGYIRLNINTNVSGQPPSQIYNANGGDGQLVYNVNNWLSVLGDLGGYWPTSSANSSIQGALVVW